MRWSFLLPLFLIGCPKSLKKEAVASIEIELPGGSMCPGTSQELIVTVNLEDGRQLRSKGAGGGDLTWRNFNFASDVAVMDKGTVIMPINPHITFQKPMKVFVTSVHHPDKRAELTIPARYNCAFAANYQGAYGYDGDRGQDGNNGSPGANSTGGAGGDGGNGGDGGHGGNGQSGQRGPDLTVQINVLREPKLLQVRVQDLDFLVDPNGGSMAIIADGGNGGYGGPGGRGGDGGSGGSGDPRGRGGNAGNGGNGGNGADGGDGGSITVIADPSARDYMDMFKLYNAGGHGGAGGSYGYAGTPGSGSSAGASGNDGQPGMPGRPGREGAQPLITWKQIPPIW